MIIAIIQGKGGVGKTTLGLLLTLTLQKAGHSVLLQDYDAQGSASQAMACWPENNPSQATTNHVIYDSPPALNAPGTTRAIDAADIILIPTTPDPLSYWEADRTARFAQDRKPSARIRMVLNKFKPRTTMAKVFMDQIASRPVPVLSLSLADRQCYQHAAVCGLDVLDPSASDELLTFTLNILAL